ncbi:aa703609-746e-4304-a73b-e246a9707016 [Thermothielavioides terrestris]|uniref:DUF7702 domain-containing protein n=2 Tax=Thermothielavioides terrestris TaxID=2587410 RepID=G2R5S4_THETT|nr:uncharacterized protein THITE_2089002 [Thermothielavioides terrestris NRRL 8126]AEO67513.1 hypothetical protein THITE_2089002 [Thermothielavioides terrestris NRRL 8126]SPQ25644.1 aa703609-746e-4304-a73b-e246a9707016 [Thermothielavioides terrestris]
MTRDPLLTAELAIYAILALPVLYLLFRHSTAGLLGWFYLFAFCSLRIVGGALTSSSAGIISSIGLSPLLLAASGILHEARTHHGLRNTKPEWIAVALFHVLVATSVALVGTGSSALEGDHPTAKDLSLVDAGVGLLTASWVLLCIGTAISFLPSQQNTAAPAHRQGTILLHATALSNPLIGIRVLYTLAALTTRRASLNPVTGSLAVRVVLGFLPELLATLVFVVAGARTRHAGRVGKGGLGQRPGY